MGTEEREVIIIRIEDVAHCVAAEMNRVADIGGIDVVEFWHCFFGGLMNTNLFKHKQVSTINLRFVLGPNCCWIDKSGSSHRAVMCTKVTGVCLLLFHFLISILRVPVKSPARSV